MGQQTDRANKSPEDQKMDIILDRLDEISGKLDALEKKLEIFK